MTYIVPGACGVKLYSLTHYWTNEGFYQSNKFSLHQFSTMNILLHL